MILSAQQDQAASAVARWFRDPSQQVFKLFGFAGTGKTTLARYLVMNESGRWLFCAFTGKAAHVMRQKGCEGARTIHSLIYRPAGESRKREIETVEMRISTLRGLVNHRADDAARASESHKPALLAEVASLQVKLDAVIAMRKDLLRNNEAEYQLHVGSDLGLPDVDGIVVDEVSMVDARMAADLESFGKKILVLGDPAQLPPVKATGYYTEQTPDFLLTEVHRQARESGILRLATHIREGGSVLDFQNSDDAQVLRTTRVSREERGAIGLASDQVLAGRNRTRMDINRRMRELRKISGGPQPGEKLVCLRNDRQLGLYNGSMWNVVEATCEPQLENPTMKLVVRSQDDDRVVVSAHAWMHDILGREEELKEMGFAARDLARFTWGDCLTVHKAQGSQWPSVMLYDESNMPNAGRKWLYTGVTRAAEKVTVIV